MARKDIYIATSLQETLVVEEDPLEDFPMEAEEELPMVAEEDSLEEDPREEEDPSEEEDHLQALKYHNPRGNL